MSDLIPNVLAERYATPPMRAIWSGEGKVRLERVDVAHDTGFGLVNPLSVKKQIEGQITWFYNDAMHQATTIANGHIVENNFDKFPLSRIAEDPPEINIRFFPTGHWLMGMGHDRATSVQAAIGGDGQRRAIGALDRGKQGRGAASTPDCN